MRSTDRSSEGDNHCRWMSEAVEWYPSPAAPGDGPTRKGCLPASRAGAVSEWCWRGGWQTGVADVGDVTQPPIFAGVRAQQLRQTSSPIARLEDLREAA